MELVDKKEELMSKQVNWCMVNYLLYDRVRTGKHRGKKTFVRTRVRVLIDCNLLLSASKCDEKLQGTQLDFSKRGGREVE